LQRVELRAVSSSASVTTDGDLLERALGNLVDNALRHARAKRIVIGVRRRPGALRLMVVDNGGGVPSDERTHLFQEFTQGRHAGGGQRGGFGLGLASVRQIAALLNGRCGIDDRWRHGSAFFIELPLGDEHIRA
jgi:signal transduction histidine kinase